MTDNPPYYLKSGAHVMISGATGAGDEKGGKTALANWWFSNLVNRHDKPDIGVFYNPKGEGFVRGKTVRSLSELKDSLKEGRRVFDYRPNRVAIEHARLIRFLRSIRGEKVVVHDEVIQYAESDMLEWILRQGGNIGNSERWRSGNIMNLVTTQHPWDIPESLGNNIPIVVWVGPTTKESDRYFTALGVSGAYDDVAENTGPHKWSVVDGGEYITTHDPVPASYAGKG